VRPKQGKDNIRRQCANEAPAIDVFKPKTSKNVSWDNFYDLYVIRRIDLGKRRTFGGDQGPQVVRAQFFRLFNEVEANLNPTPGFKRKKIDNDIQCRLSPWLSTTLIKSAFLHRWFTILI